MLIGMIHGANSSMESFNLISKAIEEKFPGVRTIFYSYDTEVKIQDILKDLRRCNVVPDILIGHSLGGVLAAGWALKEPKIKRVLSITAPLSGTYFFNPTYAPGYNISKINPIFLNISNNLDKIHLTNIISSNHQIMGEDTDGVLLERIQKTLLPEHAKKEVRLFLNHFEVLLSYKSIKEILEWIQEYKESDVSNQK